jgi:hypothetical protein
VTSKLGLKLSAVYNAIYISTSTKQWVCISAGAIFKP